MTEPGLENVKNTNRIRIAVAQTTVPEDPGDVRALRAAGEEIRTLIHEAGDGSARLVQFPEGALVYPHKRTMSSSTTTLAEADWTRANWTVLHEEAEAIAHTAAEVGIWVAFGTVRPLTPPHRPHNSFYLISDTGEVVARYDKRILSHTELTWMYTPGKDPVVVDVDGFRFGIALCIEANFPELFAEYETLDVDCVLLSVMIDDATRALIGQSYAALYNYWVGYAVPAQYATTVPSGIAAPGGRWQARCPSENKPALAFADLDRNSPDDEIRTALQLVKPWRRAARSGIHTAQQVHTDPRSQALTTF